MRYLLLAVLALSCLSGIQAQWTLNHMFTRETGLVSGAGVVAYSDSLKAAFVTSYLDQVVRMYFVQARGGLFLFQTFDVSTWGMPTSVAVTSFTGGNHALAVAVTAPEGGHVVVFDVNAGTVRSVVPVGYDPISLAITPSGNTIVVANSGIPQEGFDPEGTINVIRFTNETVNSLLQADVLTVDFQAFTSLPEGVDHLNTDVSICQDLEPQFVTISDDSASAYVSLQDNNGIAVVDIEAREPFIKNLYSAGTTDFGNADFQGLDASDRDGRVNIRRWANVQGLRRPDGLGYLKWRGREYILSINEGVIREGEYARAGTLPLDPVMFPEPGTSDDASLGRLLVSNTRGLNQATNTFQTIYAFGSRSFTVFEATNGTEYYDSGSRIEELTANDNAVHFNADFSRQELDGRSPVKGPEPEAVAMGKLDGIPFAFIVNERYGGISAWNLCDPETPVFEDFINNRDFDADLSCQDQGTFECITSGPRDLGPNSIVFVDKDESPTGEYLLITANQVSGTISTFSVLGGNTFPCEVEAASSALAVSPFLLSFALVFALLKY